MRHEGVHSTLEPGGILMSPEVSDAATRKRDALVAICLVLVAAIM